MCISICAVLMAGADDRTRSDEAPWSKGIYRLEATQCKAQEGRVSTAFKLAGEAGLISSLHGVVGCNAFEALSGDNKHAIRGSLRLDRVDIANDLAFLRADDLVSMKGYGLELAETPVITPRQTFTVPGYAYSLTSTMESILVATDASKFKELREIVPPWVREILKRQTSPALSASGIYLQGPLAKGQSGAPILNNKLQVIAVVDGGAGENGSDYVWGVALRRKQGTSITEQDGWKAYSTSDREIVRILAAPAGKDPYYASPNRIAQEVVLENIRPKATGNHPDWDLLVTVDDKPAFSLMHNHERANNIFVTGKLSSKQMKLQKDVSKASFTDCSLGHHIQITASVKNNRRNGETISGSVNLSCNVPGGDARGNIDLLSHTGPLKKEKFTLEFASHGLVPPDSN